MVCYNPILMYPVEGAITKNGKQHYSFYGSLASHPELASDSRFIRCSCKQCIGCRLENSRQWAVRAVHEARSSSSAYFVTCTFDDYHLPRDKSLSKKFHQTFMKNLRREYGSGIRFLGCGEYGELHGRPHYHYILFNIDFDDKIFRFRTDGYNTYTSSRFAKVWKYGMHLIGEFSFDSAAYVARYIVKKQTGKDAPSHYKGRIPEFMVASNRPGIGAKWLEDHGEECYSNDYVVINGKRCVLLVIMIRNSMKRILTGWNIFVITVLRRCFITWRTILLSVWLIAAVFRKVSTSIFLAESLTRYYDCVIIKSETR